MAVVPLSPSALYHFNVIYNHAKSPLSHTDDTSLSLDVTRWIVDSLENVGLVNSYYHDRDKRPNLNLAEELERVLSQSEITILILTPGFVKNCFYQYTHINAFKKLLDYTPYRLIVLEFGQEAGSRIPAALWGQEILCYKYDDCKLDTSFWCKLYNRVGYVLSLGSGDLLRQRSLTISDSELDPINEQQSNDDSADVKNTQWDPPGDHININEHTSPSLCIHERLEQTGPSLHVCHSRETGLNQLDCHYFSLDPPVSQSIDLSSFDFDVSHQEIHETRPHEYSSLLDDIVETLSTRSQDSCTKDSSVTDSPEAIMNELQYYDPHKDESDDNNCINCLKPWPTLGEDFNGFTGTEYHVDPKSTWRKYQKKYEKLLYMDDRSSNQSDTDSSEQDETNVNPHLSEGTCMFPLLRSHLDLEQDMNEKLRCLVDVDHEETLLLQSDVGNTLLKELDAIDPDYGWQLHRLCDSDLVHEEIEVKRDETKPWSEHDIINDHSSTGDQCFIDSKPYVMAYLQGYPESSEMHCNKDYNLNDDERHTDYFLSPRQDSQARTILQSHLHNSYLPTLTDGDTACPSLLMCNPNTTADFGNLNDCNAVSFNVDHLRHKHTTDKSDMQTYSKAPSELQTSMLNNFDSKRKNSLKERCVYDTGGIFPSLEYVSTQKLTLENNAVNTSVIKRGNASNTDALTDLRYFAEHEKENNSNDRFEEYRQSLEPITVGQNLILNNELRQSMTMNNNLNLNHWKHIDLYDTRRIDSKRTPYLEENYVPHSQDGSKRRYCGRKMGARVHRECPDPNDIPRDTNKPFTGLVNTPVITSMPLETACEMCQEKVSTLVSLYNTEDLIQRYSYQKDLKKRHTKEQAPKFSKQDVNQIGEPDGIENMSRAQDRERERSEILNRSTPDGRNGNKEDKFGTNLETALRPYDLDVADTEFHINKCDDEDIQCISTSNDNGIARQNDTHTRHNDSDLKPDENRTKMTGVASHEMIKAEESNITYSGHSRFPPVKFGSLDKRLSTDSAESQTPLDYVESLSTSPLNEGKDMELLPSISAGTDACSSTSINKGVFRNQFLEMENRLNCLNDDINAVANVINSELGIMQEANRCVMQQRSGEEQLARSIQPDSSSPSEKVQEKGTDETTSVVSKIVTCPSDSLGTNRCAMQQRSGEKQLARSIQPDSSSPSEKLQEKGTDEPTSVVSKIVTCPSDPMGTNRCVMQQRSEEEQLARSIQPDSSSPSEKVQEKGTDEPTSVVSKIVTCPSDPMGTNRCVMQQRSGEEQLARSIQPDSSSPSEKLQEKGTDEPTSVVSKIVTCPSDPMGTRIVNESFVKEIGDVQKQRFGSDRGREINISDDHKFTVAKEDNHRLTTNKEGQTLTKENHQVPTVPNHQQIVTAEIGQKTATEDDSENRDREEDIHDTSTIEDNQGLMLRKFSDCCQEITTEYRSSPQITESMNSHQIVSSENCPQTFAADYGVHIVHEEFKGNNEILWDEHAKSSPEYTLVECSTMQNTFLLSFASIAKKVTSGFDNNNIVAHILSEQITKDCKVESYELDSRSESPSIGRLKKMENATINCAIASSRFPDSCDTLVTRYDRRHGVSDYSKENDVASKSALKRSNGNCSKDENLHRTLASVENGLMISVEGANLSVENTKRHSLVEGKEYIQGDICLLKTQFGGSREDLDKSLSKTVSLGHINHKQKPKLIDNEQNLSSDFNQCAMSNPKDCEEENDKYEDCCKAKTQTEDCNFIFDGLITKPEEYILDGYRYVENKTRTNGCDKHHRDGSCLSETHMETCDGESMEIKARGKSSPLGGCRNVIQRDQNSIRPMKYPFNVTEIETLHGLPISQREACLHSSERQENQGLCETELKGNERQECMTLVTEKDSGVKTLPNSDVEKCVITSVTTKLNSPNAFKIYDYNQLDCPVFVKKNSLVNFLGHPHVERWDEDILNTSLLHAASQSSERKTMTEELKPERSPVTKRNEECCERHEDPSSKTACKLNTDLKEWTQAQMMRKKRRGTNVDGLPSSSSSSSSEEGQSDWMMSVYKGLFHGYSHPDMPFMG